MVQVHHQVQLLLCEQLLEVVLSETVRFNFTHLQPLYKVSQSELNLASCVGGF